MKIDVGVQPCPEWCTTHQGERTQVAGIVPDDANMSESKPIGEHQSTLYLDQPSEALPATAVEVSQYTSRVGDWLPTVILWHGHPMIGGEHEHVLLSQLDDDEGRRLRAMLKSRPLSTNAARALGEALIHAADLVTSILPRRCETCGEPIPEHHRKCADCEATDRRESRGRLRAVEGAT